MYCNQCGQANPDDASFCARCGAPLKAGVANAAVVPATGTAATIADAPPGWDEAAWQAVVGPRYATYYRTRFVRQHTGQGAALWHWPAFFVTFYWLLYRKLWGWALLYFVAPYVLSALIVVLSKTDGQANGAVFGVVWIVYWLAIAIGPPMLANGIYYRRCRKLIDREMRTASREQALARLEAKGGTSNVFLIVVAVLGIVFLIGILAAIAVPAYQDYTKRAKASEAIVVGLQVAQAVGADYERTGRVPDSVDPFVARVGTSPYLKAIRMNPTNAMLTLDVAFGANQGGGTVLLVPKADRDGRVTWTCNPDPVVKRFMPQSCRGDRTGPGATP